MVSDQFKSYSKNVTAEICRRQRNILFTSICKRTRYTLTCMVNQTRAIVKTIMLNVFFFSYRFGFLFSLCAFVARLLFRFAWFLFGSGHTKMQN